MADTKEEILGLLARKERSAATLAEALAMTPTGIRQHLNALEAQGLIVRRKQGGEPNRPTYLYRLSDSGKAAAPRKYDILAVELLRTVKDQLGTEGAIHLIERAGAQMTKRLPAMPDYPAARVQSALSYLNTTSTCEGDVSSNGDGTLRVTLYQCPFQSVSKEHPEVCPAFFGGLLRVLVGAETVSCTRIPEGVACCQLTVSPKPA